jgi:anti-sigma regulatory factor (Ser/Thr protein kinase)
VVQFYGHVDELAERVGAFLADAIDAGGVAIVVATEDHARAVAATLVASGLDAYQARVDGHLVVLDAQATMDRFLVGGRPDRDHFDAVIGGLIRDAAASGRPVRVFGEMVALLWDAGLVNAAIEVETLWNDLSDRVSFSLLCGYAIASVGGDDHAGAFQDVCRLHSAVIGAGAVPWPPAAARPEAARTFAHAPESVRDARRFVIETLEAWDHGQPVDEAALIVTELATNAVVHAQSGFTVAISALGDGVRIAVRDANPLSPSRRESALLEVSGRGLGLVGALSRQWGTDLLDDGKVVWADIRRMPSGIEPLAG